MVLFRMIQETALSRKFQVRKPSTDPIQSQNHLHAQLISFSLPTAPCIPQSITRQKVITSSVRCFPSTLTVYNPKTILRFWTSLLKTSNADAFCECLVTMVNSAASIVIETSAADKSVSTQLLIDAKHVHLLDLMLFCAFSCTEIVQSQDLGLSTHLHHLKMNWQVNSSERQKVARFVSDRRRIQGGIQPNGKHHKKKAWYSNETGRIGTPKEQRYCRGTICMIWNLEDIGEEESQESLGKNVTK